MRVRKATTAKTKAEADRLGADLERQAERQREGLEALPAQQTLTLGEVVGWWHEAYPCGAERAQKARTSMLKHITATPISKRQLRGLTAGDVEAHLLSLRQEPAELGNKSINHLRGYLHTAFETAIRTSRWSGANIIAKIPALPLNHAPPSTLAAGEVAAVLRQLTGYQRPLFASAIFTGLRKGELLGLKKSNVDLLRRVIMVTRSYGRKTTKNRKAEPVPILEPLVPYLEEALATPGELMFPSEGEKRKGQMRSEETKLQSTLRRAMARAGIVESYEHGCRRCKSRKTPHVETHPDDALRKCPKCGMQLWVKGNVRQIRFHDLRHTTATLMLNAGVPLAVVSRILRHSDVRLTLNTYGHLEVEALRLAVAGKMDLPGMAALQQASEGTPKPAAQIRHISR